MFQTRIIKKQLHFKQPAGTSRGVYTTRNVWYILLTDTDNHYYGVGECAPLPALSCDDVPNYDELLAIACKNFEKTGKPCFPIHLFCSVWKPPYFISAHAAYNFGTLHSAKEKQVSLSMDLSGWEALMKCIGASKKKCKKDSAVSNSKSGLSILKKNWNYWHISAGTLLPNK